MAGVSYIDDDQQAKNKGNYHGVPVIARQYPSPEILYASRTDLVVAGFSSAFTGGPLARETLNRHHIGSYLLSAACLNSRPPSIELALTDIRTLGEILGKQERAVRLIADIQHQRTKTASLPHLTHPPSVFFYDSGDSELHTQGERGFVSVLLHEAGAKNTFDEIQLSNFTVSAEALIQRDPDIILLTDAIWSTADSKIALLEQHPALSQLRAVREKRYIVIPFTHLYPGIYSGSALYSLALKIRELNLPRSPSHENIP